MKRLSEASGSGIGALSQPHLHSTAWVEVLRWSGVSCPDARSEMPVENGRSAALVAHSGEARRLSNQIRA